MKQYQINILAGVSFFAALLFTTIVLFTLGNQMVDVALGGM